MTDAETRLEAEALIVDFFDGDIEKSSLWWKTGNPIFGHCVPTLVATIRGWQYVLDMIRTELKENE